MLETGQPLHAFDWHLLDQEVDGLRSVVIRRAREGEKFTTLDGKEHALTGNALLIADKHKGIALAGIMGGQNTEINNQTREVLIESANFKPQNIRATSKQLDLRTDSSYRFERGADIGICDWASRRAAQLIQQLAGGEILAEAIDAYPNPQPPRVITLRARKVDELLGIQIPLADQVRHLAGLGFKVNGESGSEFKVEPPSFRVDIKREADLIEEIARMHGIDRIPSTPPRGAVGSNPFDAVYDQYARVRGLLNACGLSEAQGQTLISDEAVKALLGADALDHVVRLENPLSSDMNVLRPSLIPGLLDSLRHNLHHGNGTLRLFEIGRVFGKNGGELREERRVAMALTGNRSPDFWSGAERDAKLDAYDLKGVLEEFLEQIGTRGAQWVRNDPSPSLYVESATVLVGKHPAGQLGQLHPLIARKYDLRDAVLVAEFNLDFLLQRRTSGRSYKPIAAFPSVRRDLAMLVNESLLHDQVLAAVKSAKAANLESTFLFDIYRGKGIPEGRKSVAYAFTYRNSERTLTENEVNAAHEKVVAQLKDQLNAEIRA
jgi:phenylalanyl-tRNA synthetase beta chain